MRYRRSPRSTRRSSFDRSPVDTQTVVPVPIEPADFFAPSSLALLVQHLAVTFAALSLVRDRELGLFELLRVGPLSSVEILVGKTIAYLLVGLVVGVGLLAASVQLLGVPLAGDAAWAVGSIALVLLASLSLGLLISLVSGSETQAVQWSMLTLLAGLFFGGFFLDLDGLLYPVKALSWLLPVTYGIRLLQDVMLRGIDPAPVDIAGVVGPRRRLRRARDLVVATAAEVRVSGNDEPTARPASAPAPVAQRARSDRVPPRGAQPALARDGRSWSRPSSPLSPVWSASSSPGGSSVISPTPPDPAS